MPEKCYSCGEYAVIEDEVEGGSTQRICIECGTVATGIKASPVTNTKSFHYEGDEEDTGQICESCGDNLPVSGPPGAKLCFECEELEARENENEEQTSLTPPNSEMEKKYDVSPLQDVQTCKSCSSTNLGYDSVAGDERLVCLDCGTVAGDETLANDEYEIMTRPFRNSVPTLPRFASRPQKLVGRTAGHDKISYLHNRLGFPDVIKEEAVEMFDKAYYQKQFLRGHSNTKEHLASACVFIVCRLHDFPVSLTQFKEHVDKFSMFIRMKKIVLRCLNISLPHMTLTSHVGQLLGERKFSSKLISKAKDILLLCSRAFVTQGKPREALIVMAAYYAYQSSDECQGNIKVAEFAHRFKFEKPSNSLQSEFSNIFMKLANRVPWVLKKNIKTNTVYRYTDDILKYQNSLFQLAFKSESHSIQEHNKQNKNIPRTPSPVKISRGTQHSYSQMHSDNDKSKCTPVKVISRKRQIKSKRKSEDFPKELLIPKVLKKPRVCTPFVETKISPHIDLDNPDVTAAEFDDDEITSYLLTPEEESRMRSPKLKAMNS